MADAHRESERKGVASFKPGHEAAGSLEEIELVVTINPTMGNIFKVEKVDKIPRSVRRRIMHRLLLSRMLRLRFLKRRLRQ
jgi:hypothetical protein